MGKSDRAREESIHEEVRRRVLAQAQSCAQQAATEQMHEANIEALVDVVDLPREDIERIDREVRAERARIGRTKKLWLALTVGSALCTAGLLTLYGLVKNPTTVPHALPTPSTGPTPEPGLAAAPIKPVVAAVEGPILSHGEAKAVLTPELRACLRDHGVHHLIVHLGQPANAPPTGPLAPLQVGQKAWVDYREVNDFSTSPLGGCAARAAKGVRCAAFGGNYLRFELRHRQVPDPLAGAAQSLSHAAAKRALARYDGEARECARRFPAGAKPGQTISVAVTFRGVDGHVTFVGPYYLDSQSAYSRCLVAAYSQAAVPKFRNLTGRWVHQLKP